jgi:hypothetical protein
MDTLGKINYSSTFTIELLRRLSAHSAARKTYFLYGRDLIPYGLLTLELSIYFGSITLMKEARLDGKAANNPKNSIQISSSIRKNAYFLAWV